jgi:predicted dinucleotide-binding enzyme
MNIAVLGAGNIGGSLALAWALHGHAVRLGVRDPLKPEVQQLVAQGGHQLSAAPLADAAAWSAVVVLAVPGAAAGPVVVEHAAALDGKLVIDATNNFRAAPSEPVSALPALAQHATRAQGYRAFNSVGWENLRQPRYGRQRADLFFCGPDGAGRDTVAGLIDAVGMRPIYVGGPEQLPLVDNLGRLWVTLVRGQGFGRRLAFRLLTEADESGEEPA